MGTNENALVHSALLAERTVHMVNPQQRPPVILSEVRRQPNAVEGPHTADAELTQKAISTMNQKYWTYLVANRTGTLYIGVTNNIVSRAWQHKTAQFEGFAGKYHCNRLVYYEGFTNILSAIAQRPTANSLPSLPRLLK